MARVVYAVALLVFSSSAVASDWKYAGYLGSTGEGNSVAFYDSESLVRDGVRFRYWVKTIPQKTLDNFPTGKRKQDEFGDAAARKLGSGYVPPLLTATSLRRTYENQRRDYSEFVLTVVMWELAANRIEQVRSRVLFEIDCQQKTIRTLDGDVYDKKGKRILRSGPPKKEWKFIAPDTNAAWMSEVFCAK